MTIENNFEPKYTEWQVQNNLSHLSRLKDKNSLVNDVLSGSKSFLGETKDLFYFFEDPWFYYKNILKTPKLRENHNLRLFEIEESLNGADLLTRDDRKQLSNLEKDFEEQLQSLYQFQTPISRINTGSDILRNISTEKFYNGLGSSSNKGPDIKEYYADNLKTHLKDIQSSKRMCYLVGSSLYSALAAAGTEGLVYPLFGFFAGLGIGWSSQKFHSLTSQHENFVEYNLLKEKSSRLDDFVNDYVFSSSNYEAKELRRNARFQVIPEGLQPTEMKGGKR